MTPPLVSHNDPARNINNEEFLRAIFGDDWEDAWVTGFLSDPDDKTVPDAESRWTGGPWRTHKGLLAPDRNTYFSLSIIKDGQRRWKKHLRAFYCFVLDDIGSPKAPEGARIALDRVGPPSWRLMTSPGNEQWGYILSRPETNIAKAEALLKALGKLGLSDGGGQGVVRYARLPVGTNTKGKYVADLGAPFGHQWGREPGWPSSEAST